MKNQLLFLISSHFVKKSVLAFKKMNRSESDRKGFLERFNECKPSPAPDFVNYKKLRFIGQGGFGVVILFQHKPTTKFYACKRLNKVELVKKGMVDQVIKEKRMLCAIDYPFVIRLLFSWKDDNYLYLFMPFIRGGDMIKFLMKNEHHITETVIRFFAAQLLLAINYLHDMNVVHRDIKLENVLIEPSGYIKLADLGVSALSDEPLGRLCGTTEYMSPEMIHSLTYGKSTDWWSYGIFVWEMSFGETPFYRYRHNEWEIYERIQRCEYKIPKCSKDLHHLLSNLLIVNINKRLGCNGINELMGHKWFRKIKWDALESQKMKPPLKPIDHGPGDTLNFDFYQEEKLKCPYHNIPDLYEKEFSKF